MVSGNVYPPKSLPLLNKKCSYREHETLRVQERQELKQSTVLNTTMLQERGKVAANVDLRDTNASFNIFFPSLFCISRHHTVIIQKQEYAARDAMLAVIIHYSDI